MVTFFFTLSGLSFVLMLLIRHTESWGWPVPSFADSWEQVGTWATYALVFFLAVALSIFCFRSPKTGSE